LNIYHANSCKIVKDGEFFRVEIIVELLGGTHKLHSEKLEVENASRLFHMLLTGEISS